MNYMFLSNNPSLGDINSLNLPCSNSKVNTSVVHFYVQLMSSLDYNGLMLYL